MFSKKFRNLSLTPLLSLVFTLVISRGAVAEEVSPIVTLQANGGVLLADITSVSQLSDVRVTDWYFGSLQSLVERYGCIEGYPDATFRSEWAIKRSEFAAALNKCLDKVLEQVNSGGSSLEELATIQRLQKEFAAELSTLRGRTDVIESRVEELEENQFSTTTKLRGSVIFTLNDTFGEAIQFRGDKRDENGFRGNPNDDETQTTLSYRARLNFESTFTGKDKLRTRIQAGNIVNYGDALGGTNMARLGYEDDSENTFELDELWYRFPIGDRLMVQVDATASEFYDGMIDPLSPFRSADTGSLSRFGRFNPLFRAGGNNGTGFNVEYKFDSDGKYRIQGGYVAEGDSNDPAVKNGLFNGGYTALGQFVLKPSKKLTLAATYTRNFSPAGQVNLTSNTGSENARRPFGNDVATSADSVSAQFSYSFSKKFNVGGWFGAQFADVVGDNPGDATILNGALLLQFKDVGKTGSDVGVILGVPPKVTEASDPARKDVGRGTAIHAEAFYRYQVNKSIQIQPGVFVIVNPDHDNRNDTIFVGAVRTTFTF